MKSFFLFCALIGLFLGTITVSAAPATPEHPIVKEIVGYMLNQPAEMEKKIADAIDRFKVENRHRSYPEANKNIAKRLAYTAVNGTIPWNTSKRSYFTDTVIVYLGL